MDTLITEHRKIKDNSNFRDARAVIDNCDEQMLEEILLTVLKVLDDNGAWNFEVTDQDGAKVINFRYNGTIAAADAISQLPLSYRNCIKTEWK